MGDLNREQLADITEQRLQENIARKNRQTGKQIDEANTQISSLQTQIDKMKSSYIDFSFSLSGNGGSTTQTHNLGQIPTGWQIIDHTGDVADAAHLIRTAWSTTTITFKCWSMNSNTFGWKVRVFI